jgi:hypothetical protein
LLEIGIVEPRVGQRLDLADGCQVVDIVSCQPAPVNLEGIGVDPAASPAKQFFEISIDRKIKAAEMDGAARDPARYVADVIGDVSCTEIQTLGGQSVMPLVKPFRGQPLRRAFVFGAGERTCACRDACEIRCRNYDPTSQRRHLGGPASRPTGAI